MSSRSNDLADAIVALLNDEDNDFVLEFTARRASSPLTETELTDAKEVQVLVFPGARKSERVTRGSTAKSYKPVIGVQRSLTLPSIEANEQLIDQLQELVEQIEDSITDVDDLSFVGFEEDQYAEIYSTEALRDLSFFAAAIEAEYTSGQ